VRLSFNLEVDLGKDRKPMGDWINNLKKREDEKESRKEWQDEVRLHDAALVRAKASDFFEIHNQPDSCGL
jgi:hypothetical protein